MERGVNPDFLKSLAFELWNDGAEIGPGSAGVEAALSVLEDAGAEVRRVSFPSLAWKLREAAVEPVKGWVAASPYNAPADVEAPAVFVGGDAADPRSWRGFREGAIAVVGEPDNPDDMKAVALLAWEHGAQGVVVGCRDRRVIVVTGVWGYSYVSGAPPPLPIVCVPLEAVPRILAEGRARILVDSVERIVEAVTYEATIGGDGWVYFTAHKDRWRGGFADDTLGVAQAVAAALEASRRGVPVRVVLFDSEEHGALGHAGWYWAWGSRFYYRQLAAAGLEEAARLVVNFDLASVSPLRASGSPQVLGVLPQGGGWVERCCECPECDSFQAAVWAGAPTLSLHGLWSSEVRAFYHTPRDGPDRVDWGAAWLAVQLAVKAAVAEPAWHAFEARLAEWLRGPLRARRLLYAIVGTAARAGWEPVYRRLSRTALKAVHWGSYRWGEGDLEAVWFPEVEALRRTGYDEVIIAGEERPLYQGGPAGAREQAGLVLSETAERVEEELRELTA